MHQKGPNSPCTSLAHVESVALIIEFPEPRPELTRNKQGLDPSPCFLFSMRSNFTTIETMFRIYESRSCTLMGPYRSHRSRQLHFHP